MTEWVKLADTERAVDGMQMRRTMVESGTFTTAYGFVPDCTHSVVFEKVKPPLPTTVGSVIKAVSPDTGDKATLFIRGDYERYPWIHVGGDMSFNEEDLESIEVVFTAPEGLLK